MYLLTGGGFNSRGGPGGFRGRGGRGRGDFIPRGDRGGGRGVPMRGKRFKLNAAGYLTSKLTHHHHHQYLLN